MLYVSSTLSALSAYAVGIDQHGYFLFSLLYDSGSFPPLPAPRAPVRRRLRTHPTQVSAISGPDRLGKLDPRLTEEYSILSPFN